MTAFGPVFRLPGEGPGSPASSPRPPGRCAGRRRRLVHDFLRGLVEAQPFERRMADHPRIRPAAELDLGDELRREPPNVRFLPRRILAAERADLGRVLLEHGQHLASHRLAVTRTDATDVFESSVPIDAGEQRAKSAASRWSSRREPLPVRRGTWPWSSRHDGQRRTAHPGASKRCLRDSSCTRTATPRRRSTRNVRRSGSCRPGRLPRAAPSAAALRVVRGSGRHVLLAFDQQIEREEHEALGLAFGQRRLQQRRSSAGCYHRPRRSRRR